jgi:DNA-binding transcriptional MerR regulator
MDENPATLIEVSVAGCLELAATWLHWDGRPFVAEGGDRIYTPHKAIRRIADHLIDHLAEVEALLAQVPTRPDNWHGSLVTLDSDWARFTESDLEESRERLTRLARTFALRMRSAGPQEWDRERSANWTLREISVHVSEVRWYAEQVGRLDVPG